MSECLYIFVLNEQFQNIKADDITTATKMLFLENCMKQDGGNERPPTS